MRQTPSGTAYCHSYSGLRPDNEGIDRLNPSLHIDTNMKRLDIPFMFIGPAGTGKTKELRRIIEDANGGKINYPLEMRNFVVGDNYEARVLTSPYHFEIDIPNLSMQDKQIIGDLLTSFFSSGDVLNSLRSSTRKIVVLRRAHSLSLAAAIRVRAIIQQFVLPPDAAGMLWITAREITGPLALLDDAFVRYRMPRMSFDAWQTAVIPAFANATAYEKCEGRVDRVNEMQKYFPNGLLTPTTCPRRIQDFYDEMIHILIINARSGKAPNLQAIQWVRGIVYQALSFCQTGPEIIDSCAAAIERQYELLEPKVFWLSMKSLTKAEPHTSYRTPLSLESAILFLFETIRTHSTPIPLQPHKKETPLQNELRSGVSTTAATVSSPPAEEAPKPATATKPPRVRRIKKADS